MLKHKCKNILRAYFFRLSWVRTFFLLVFFPVFFFSLQGAGVEFLKPNAQLFNLKATIEQYFSICTDKKFKSI